MRAFAITLTQDPALADDIVQDAAIKAWINFGSFEIGTNLRAWLFTILRNTFYSEMRKRRPKLGTLDETAVQNLSVRPGHDESLALRDFLGVFRTLGLEQREALLLIGAMGFTYEEAAEMCGVPTGTMKSRTHRARAILAERLEAAGLAADV